jgi:NADH-quinone oxidoreductase subunit L
MPITWICMLIGSVALIGLPPFAGFFSKDAIISAVHHSHIWGSEFAYVLVVLGVFITALYTFRMYFLVFHTEERMDEHTKEHLRESPWVVTVPLIMLAIPSVLAGMVFVMPMLFEGFFGSSIHVLPDHNVLREIGEHDTGVMSYIAHGVMELPFWLALAGVASAWFFYVKRPDLPEVFKNRLLVMYNILIRKYGFDEFNDFFFAGGARGIGKSFWNIGDIRLIDGLLVNGTARTIGWIASKIRNIQTGYLYHYAFAMIVGLVGLVLLFLHY